MSKHLHLQHSSLQLSSPHGYHDTYARALFTSPHDKRARHTSDGVSRLLKAWYASILYYQQYAAPKVLLHL
ncbi:hypothetical protein COCVIDRAFT_87163 [Bipolaris victoriae FI3]|uniref:Uncharacterized protein n=2 Tax=Bipolaris TaxID=33194 RepID=W6YGX7_COCC2|nr:uncharacterized protein COCCADRAFT_103552 [Bipolaris zeicola 26-R-13]XP_014561188.1 hypothetical protein COCVIDRAFT_87163 [Bipolaris victoriae FI3]EUC30591.1 hypothetical protein COCCADRAFT_103552 [Bipolaris zeicola 26-R-13]